MLPLNLGRSGMYVTIVLLISWFAVNVMATRGRRSNRDAAALVGTVTSGLLVSLSIVFWAWLNGTSLSMLAWGMLGQHGGFAKTFFQPIPVDLFSVVSSVLVVASYWHRKTIGIASFICWLILVLDCLRFFGRMLEFASDGIHATGFKTRTRILHA